jgi:hypothetical protein
MMKKIRLGILIEDQTLAWYNFKPLKSLVDEGIVEVCIAVQRSTKQKHSILKSIPLINQKIFSFLSRTKSNAKRYSIHDLIANGKMPVVISIPKQGKCIDEIENSVIEKLETAELDYLLNIGCGTLTGRILSASKNGILFFHYGDESIQRGTSTLYWQFAEKWENSVVTLQLLNDHLKVNKVVGKGYGTLFYWDYNLTKHKLNGVAASILYWYFHKNKIGAESETIARSTNNRKVYKTSQRLTAIRHLSRFLKQYTVKTFYKSFYLNQWSIFIGSVDQSIQTYTEILPEKGCFWADPFYIERDSKSYIFFESLNYNENIGRIEWLELDESYQVIDSGPVDLGISSHLSFPNVFEHEDSIYMIPEAADTHCINLFKATGFPQKWEKVNELVSGVQAADSAVIEHNGLWYLFTTHGSVSNLTMDLELHIYISNKLESDNWTIHPRAPFKIDVRGSRLAGALFWENGQLFRSAQDGTIRYGRRIALYLVEELTPMSYKEVFVRYIEPDWETDIDRLHTYNVYNQTVVLDVSRDKLRFRV